MGDAKNRLEAKKEAFNKNPEQFIHLSEIVMAVRFNEEKKMESFINQNYGGTLSAALGVLVCEAPFAVQYAKTAKAQADAPAIITPGGNNGKNRIA